MRMRLHGRGWLLAGLGIGALGGAAAGCRSGSDAARAEETAAPTVTLGPENVAVVETMTLRSGPNISGTLDPERKAVLRAEVAGAIVELRAEAGQPVRRGTVLARIDETALQDAFLSARAAVRSAETALQVARRNAERSEALAAAGAIAERDLEQARWNAMSAEAALADAQARLAAAGKQLGKTTLRAPFDGVVSEARASLGDVVQPGAELFTVVDPSSMELAATVPADRLAELTPGTAVEFTVSGFPGRSFTGRVQRINPAVDPATRQVRIYATIPNAGRALVAGLFAEGRVATVARTGPAVPLAAVDERGTTPALHRIRRGRVERVPVRLGLRDDVAERVIVESGVAAGDTVLLGSAQGLTEGTEVRVRRDPVGAAGGAGGAAAARDRDTTGR